MILGEPIAVDPRQSTSRRGDFTAAERALIEALTSALLREIRAERIIAEAA